MSHVSGAQVLVLTGWLALAMSAAALPLVPITNPESVVIRFEPVDNTPGGSALDGFVTTDIRFDLGENEEYEFSELLIELQQGGFYRDPLGSLFGVAPRPEDLRQSQSLAFDTYFAGPGAGGGAFDLGASPIAVFPASGERLLSQAWSAPATLVTGVTNYLDARATLSLDANGTFEYLLFSTGGVSFREGRIANGVFVPEPAAGYLMLAIAITTKLRRRDG